MKLLSKFSEGGWNIAFRSLPAASILEDRSTPFSLIPNTWRSWAADPFVFIHEGTTYVFAEVFDYLTRRGSIGYSRCIGGKWTKWKTVIAEAFHMSYPNVFACNGQIYMVPETSEDCTLRLYKAVSFPDVWALEKVIAEDVMWVDTTFFEHNGHRCAITTDIHDSENHKDLLLQLDSQWNLVNSLVIAEKQPELSRSGGNFFAGKQGQLRVSQDCRGHYGSALVFSRFCPDILSDAGLGEILLQLTPEDLSIRTVRRWTGLHTYNSAENIEVIDIERRHYNPAGVIGRIIWKIRMRLAR